MDRLRETIDAIRPADETWRGRARDRLEQLTMPHWAMGRLMDLAVDLAGMTRSLDPPTGRKVVLTMAADHGVTVQGVSLYPQEVTTQMVNNFLAGGACINAVAGLAGAELFVVDMGVAQPDPSWLAHGRLLRYPVACGTADMTAGPAMTREQAVQSVARGIAIVTERLDEMELLALGEMGIGNTTAAAAVGAALIGCEPAAIAGRGTGLDDGQLQQKIEMIGRALEVTRPDPDDAIDVLAKVGGFEIGGIAGVILGAAAQRRPVIIDGFPCTAGALIAHALAPACADYMIAGHQSEEPGHALMLRHLGKRALHDLQLRLGEGTGAALAMHLVDAAVCILTDVATFEEAAVSKATS